MATPIVILSDFGSSEYYTAMMKGVIKSIIPETEIIDLYHNIEPQNIGQAAFLLVNSYMYFPQGSVFVSVVDPGVGSDRKGLIVKTGGRYFVGPDNGCFSFILEDNPDSEIYIINRELFDIQPASHTFHGRDVFAPAAARLAAGWETDSIALKTNKESFAKYLGFKRIFKAYGITEGIVVMVDSYGNLITNIHRNAFDRILDKSLAPAIEISGIIINGLKNTYIDAKKGDFLAYTGSMDYLEIGVNCGNAARELGISAGAGFSLRI